jgi:ATP-dependent helicase/nuclease subunit B
MQARGRVWLDHARQLRAPGSLGTPEPRPSPIPPPGALADLSVTGVARLIRDPYAVYAQKVLGLRPLDPLRPQPDAAERGTILHDIVHDFLTPPPGPLDGPDVLRDRLLEAADRVLERDVPWPAARLFWTARIRRIADRLAADEHARLQLGSPALVEDRHTVPVPGLDVRGRAFRLTAKPDRIDHLRDGTAHVYDYKSGKPPSDSQMAAFDKQLLLEAAMVERGMLGEARRVSGISYIRLGGPGETETRAASADLFTETWDRFVDLISCYLAGGQGFTARAALQSVADRSDYDGISRFGEWTTADAAHPQQVGDHD